MTKDGFDGLIVCENQCGSPVFAYSTTKWIFETNRLETRVVCDGCDYIQSKQYSEDLINGRIKPPMPTYFGDWVYPDDDDYQEVVHYTYHEKLIQIDNRSKRIRLWGRYA